VDDVAVIGSANLDLVATVERHPHPGETLLGTAYAEFAGGKGLNQAVAASRAGAAVSFVGAVGSDEAGARLRRIATDEGIDVEHLATADAPTGRAIIVVATSGENSIVVVPGANSLVRGGQVPRARVVLAQLEVPLAAVDEALRTARANGSTTVLNPAPARQLSTEMLGLCDVVIPNEHEIDLLGGVDALLDAGVGTVIVTRGAEGVSVHRAGQPMSSWPSPKVDVVDTTGAGDAFCGNFVARLAAGSDIEAAVRWAVVAGAIAVTKAGAVPSLPDAADVAAYLSDSH
jgi:ribokinase